MLELILTRSTPVDRKVLDNAAGLEFLVLDEFHTYRGRQGADVAMLVRRVQNRIGAPSLRFVGTSATIAGEGDSRRERAGAVAEVASKLFGTSITVDEVISETLEASVAGSGPAPSTDDLAWRLGRSPAYPHDARELLADPVAQWVEGAFGITHDGAGELIRQTPTTIPSAAAQLERLTGVDRATCEAHLKAVLMAGYGAIHPDTGRRVFAFRLHQFVSRGDTVYTSLDGQSVRYLTLDEQQFVPDSGRAKRLFPLAFCRECGEEYAVVDYHADDQSIESRRLRETAGKGDRHRSGFLFFDHAGDWGDRELDEQYPEDWLETAKNGSLRVKSSHRNRQAIALALTPDGTVAPMATRRSALGSCPRRSGSACTAESPTASAAATSGVSPNSRPRAAALRRRSSPSRSSGSSGPCRRATLLSPPGNC